MKSDTRTMPTLLTYEDYCHIPNDGNRYEVVDGVLHMSPCPINSSSANQYSVGQCFI